MRWLLEELGLPHELLRVEFRPATMFSQATPLGKIPVLEDGETVIGESGAILEYILERHADGRLAPPVGCLAEGRGPHAEVQVLDEICAPDAQGYHTFWRDAAPGTPSTPDREAVERVRLALAPRAGERTIVGFACFRHLDKRKRFARGSPEIRWIEVLEPHRRRGFGGAMLRELERRCRRERMYVVPVPYLARDLRCFLRSYGYHFHGVNGADARFYERSLDPSDV